MTCSSRLALNPAEVKTGLTGPGGLHEDEIETRNARNSLSIGAVRG